MTQDSAEGIEQQSKIHVFRGNSKERGSCNACTQYITPSGCRYHTVYEITLGGMLVRVCESCRRELISKL